MDLDDLIAHPVKEVPVVCHHEQGDIGPLEIAFQPLDHVDVQVVGRFVKDEHLRLGKDELPEGNPFFLTARQGVHILVEVSEVQPVEQVMDFRGNIPCFPVIHGQCRFLKVFSLPCLKRLLVGPVGFNPWDIQLQDIFPNRGMCFQDRLLREISNAQVIQDMESSLFTFNGFITHQHPEECGFPTPVFGNEPDLVALVDPQRDVVQEYFLPEGLGCVFYRDVVHCRK